ncbi:MAG: M36 family metallopeptidase [Phycisphaerales bacterium]|nr:M36 family metallopeptidase [Phycisphaerales bacterium]
MRQTRHRSRPVGLAVAVFGLLAGAAIAADRQSPAAAARQARIQRQLADNPDSPPTLAGALSGLPNFDIRATGPHGATAEFINQSLEDFSLTPAGQARAKAAAALAASLPELRIDDDPFLGTPRFVRSTRVFLTAPVQSDKPADIDHTTLLARYLAGHAALFEIDPIELAVARPSRDYHTRHNGVHHLGFQQQIAGRDLFGCELRANFTRDHELINVSSVMLPRQGLKLAAPRLTAAAAIRAAAANVGIALSAAPSPEALDAAPESSKTRWARHAELRADEPLTTEPIYFPLTRTDIRPAFMVVLPIPGVGHTYHVIVDASTGQILWRADSLVWDTTQPMQFRVFTGDSPAPLIPGRNSPDSFQPPTVDRTLVTVLPAEISAINTDGWLADGVLETLGNNFDAHTDHDSNNSISGIDLPRPTATLSGPSNTRVFDFPLDLAQAPATYRDAAVTQFFYWGNWYHDRLHEKGFDEPAGNFQTSNFDRGGVGNDAIIGDAQDGNGGGGNTNNANFSTTPLGTDGASGRVQMYLWDAPEPDRDGDLDASIVFHELTHGTSIRLHGGLFNNQSGGMGEGWSDFVALCLLTNSSHDPNAPYAFGGYSTLQLWGAGFTSNYYSGIRRYPYSTNFNINPLTLKFIDWNQIAYPPSVPRNTAIADRFNSGGNTFSTVHGMGEVWCNALWECRAALWADEGPSANQTILQLVIDGMKLAVSNPTFVQSRDAIVQADMVNQAAAHRIPLWEGFARRGLGFAAFTPASTGSVGTIEDFQLPFRAVFAFPDGLPARLDPGVAAGIRVTITPDGVDLIPGTAMLHIAGDGVTPATIPLTPNPSGDYTATIPPQDCFAAVRYWFTMNTSLGESAEPPAGASGAYAVSVFTGLTPNTSDDFETDRGWIVGASTAGSGLWTRGNPNGTTAQPEDDHSPDAGVNCWFTGQGTAGSTAVGEADVDGGATTLVSPVFNLAAEHDVQFSYWRWYANGVGNAPFSDTFRVDVSTNGGVQWTNAETVGPSDSADTRPGWRFASWTLSSLGLTTSATVLVRFVAEDAGSGSIIEAAIDDFAIESVACTPPPACPADFNEDGAATLQDLFDFLTAFFANNPDADFNASGGVSLQDIFDYLTAYFTGC